MFVVLGWSKSVYMINLQTRIVEVVDCDCGFCYLYPFDNFLLIASASELIRLESEGNEVWRCRNLAVDGVVINRIENGIIYGNGEWDPPSGWRGFEVNLETGQRIRREMNLCWV